MPNIAPNKNTIVRVASTTNINLLPTDEPFEFTVIVAGDLTIDGIIVIVGDKILLKDQIDSVENYIVEISLIIDIGGGNNEYHLFVPDAGLYLSKNDIVFILEGLTLAQASFILDFDDNILTVGANEIIWLPFNESSSSTVSGIPPTTVNAITRWNDTTATSIKNSTVIIDDSGNFTNATIVDVSNTVAATQLRTTGADVIISTAAPPVAGQYLYATSPTTAIWGGSGIGRVSYTLSSTLLSATSTSFISVPLALFPWSSARFGTYTDGTITFFATITNNDLQVRFYDITNAISLGTSPIISATGIISFLVANPVSDATIELQIRKIDSGGVNPTIRGVLLEYEA